MHKDNIHLWQHSHAFGQHIKRRGESRTLIVIAITGAMMVIEKLRSDETLGGRLGSAGGRLGSAGAAAATVPTFSREAGESVISQRLGGKTGPTVSIHRATGSHDPDLAALRGTAALKGETASNFGTASPCQASTWTI